MTGQKSTTISTETFIRGILMILMVYVLFLLRSVIVLLLVSIVIATFIESWVRFLRRFKIRREVSVPVIFSIMVLIILAVMYSFIPVIFRELSGVLTLITKYLPSSSTIIDNQSIQGASQLVSSFSGHMTFTGIIENIKTFATSLSNGVTSIIGTTFGGVVDMILVLVMAFYLSIQEKGITTILRILTPTKYIDEVIDLWQRSQHKIGLWFQGQLFLGLMMGVITFIALSLFKVQYAFLIAVITGISELIPFGIIFAAIPAIVFAAIDGGVLLAFKVLLYYVIAQQIENYVLSPLVAKRVVGIPPLIVLLAFLIGITLAGFWGAIIAMPAALFILEYISDVEKKKSVIRVAEVN